MTRPDFLIIGAQKSGTSWLRSRLHQHPELYLPEEELHFFDKGYHYERGMSWYEEQFSDAGAEKRVGEKTPDYFWTGGAGAEDHLPEVHRRIHRHLPDARLILTLRNPVDRAISAVNHLIRTGRISPFQDVDSLLFGEHTHLTEPHRVLAYGRYAEHLDGFLSLFDRNQILVLIFEEDIVETPRRGLERVCSFLNVDPNYDFDATRESRGGHTSSFFKMVVDYYVPFLRRVTSKIDSLLGSHYVRPSEEVVERLYDYYEEEQERLFDLLDREQPDAWKR